MSFTASDLTSLKAPRSTRAIFLPDTVRGRHRCDRITETRAITTLPRLRHRKLPGPRPASSSSWPSGLWAFLGGKDLLVLEPLRHEPTAQHYLPGDSSQRLPSVRETETGFRIRPETCDWLNTRRARGWCGILDQCGCRNYAAGYAHGMLFSSWNWIDAWLQRLVGANQLVLPWNRPQDGSSLPHNRCETPFADLIGRSTRIRSESGSL